MKKAIDARLKIIYLVVVAVVVLSISNINITLSFLLFQGLLLLWNRPNRKDLAIFRKTFSFVLAIVILNTLFSTPKDLVLLAFHQYKLKASTGGFFESLIMVARFYNILVASVLVRITTPSKDFIKALVDLKMPQPFAETLDATFESLEGKTGGDGKGGGKGQQNQKKKFTLKALLKGDFSFLLEKLDQRMEEGKARFVDPDWAVISAITIFVVGIRMIKILPGIPIAPGHKNLLVVPLFILVARLTKTRFAATYVGLLSGIISFMFGFGKYGILGILQFAVPGFIVDLLVALTFSSRSIIIFGFIGLIAGLSRVIVEVGLAWIFGLPGAFYVILTPLIISQSVFGALSAPVTFYFINHFENKNLNEPQFEKEETYDRQELRQNAS